MWNSITIEELNKEIQSSIDIMTNEELNFWQLIKIEPEKWEEDQFGDKGNGFWVVAILGKRVIWYNDIEEGFNISEYEVYKKIDGYYCNQDKLNWAINRLNNLAKFGGNIVNQAGPPKPLENYNDKS